jgi:hypothetical protein
MYKSAAAAVAKAAADRQGQTFVVADIVEDNWIDCHQRTVRRVVNDLADLGYLQADRGYATEFTTTGDPGTGQVDLEHTPELCAERDDTGQNDKENVNTRFVWSCDASLGSRVTRTDTRVKLPLRPLAHGQPHSAERVKRARKSAVSNDVG